MWLWFLTRQLDTLLLTLSSWMSVDGACFLTAVVRDARRAPRRGCYHRQPDWYYDCSHRQVLGRMDSPDGQVSETPKYHHQKAVRRGSRAIDFSIMKNRATNRGTCCGYSPEWVSSWSGRSVGRCGAGPDVRCTPGTSSCQGNQSWAEPLASLTPFHPVCSLTMAAYKSVTSGLCRGSVVHPGVTPRELFVSWYQVNRGVIGWNPTQPTYLPFFHLFLCWTFCVHGLSSVYFIQLRNVAGSVHWDISLVLVSVWC